MRRLIIALTLSALLTLGGAALAQNANTTATPIAYGETAQGELTNLDWDALYSFEGNADDVVVIDMVGESDYDTYLYLTDAEGGILSSNDDYFGVSSRILYQLPADGDYRIIATRFGERTGSATGPYTLSLAVMEPVGIGVTVEGTVEGSGTPATHAISVERNGTYTIAYRRVSGTLSPSLTVQAVVPGQSYTDEVAFLSGLTLSGGTVTLALEAGTLYLLNLDDGDFGYADPSDRAVYTLRMEAESTMADEAETAMTDEAETDEGDETDEADG